MSDPAVLPDLCVCVPARNEAERLPILMRALAEQTWPDPIKVSIAVNNSNDDSGSVIAAAEARYSGRLRIHAHHHILPDEDAHAGAARKLAMDDGLELLGSIANGILVSTDADTRPPPDWLSNIAACFARGADIVGGRIKIESTEELPATVARLRAAWEQYWHEVRAIEDEIDPIPWDLPPRHGDHTGASLAIRADLYARCGGVPPLRTGEDRALVLAAVACGGKLAHPDNVFTRASPRLEGRASGGMAEAMREMFEMAASGIAPRAPSLDHWRERAKWRQSLRAQPDGHARIAMEEPMLPPMPMDHELVIRA